MQILPPVHSVESKNSVSISAFAQAACVCRQEWFAVYVELNQQIATLLNVGEEEDVAELKALQQQLSDVCYRQATQLEGRQNVLQAAQGFHSTSQEVRPLKLSVPLLFSSTPAVDPQSRSRGANGVSAVTQIRVRLFCDNEDCPPSLPPSSCPSSWTVCWACSVLTWLRLTERQYSKT